MAKKLIIVGNTAFAEIAYEYFKFDSDYEPVAFSVESAYLVESEKMGLPVVPFETMEMQYAPADHAFFVAATYTQLNHLRERLYLLAKKKGFSPASYISSRAFVWRNAKIGEHCFIFEDNTIQPFVEMGCDVVLWSGNHIGHHSRVGNHVFVASHAVVSGFCEIGDYSFLGVNATISNNIILGRECLVGAGALVTQSIPEDTLAKGIAAESGPSARRFFKVKT